MQLFQCLERLALGAFLAGPLACVTVHADDRPATRPAAATTYRAVVSAHVARHYGSKSPWLIAQINELNPGAAGKKVLETEIQMPPLVNLIKFTDGEPFRIVRAAAEVHEELSKVIIRPYVKMNDGEGPMPRTLPSSWKDTASKLCETLRSAFVQDGKPEGKVGQAYAEARYGLRAIARAEDDDPMDDLGHTVYPVSEALVRLVELHATGSSKP